MIIAAMRLTFASAPDATSHKSIAHKIKDRISQRFKVSVSEVPSDNPNELNIGISFVGSEERFLRKKCEEIIKHLQDWAAVDLAYDEVEIIHFSDLEIKRDFEKYEP
ncbi:MAG: DUF503 family protein [Oligoflexia bacterium]|nr:DUF503 family protein [Oligoflexia bacterium]